jgi:hypothetical protein
MPLQSERTGTLVAMGQADMQALMAEGKAAVTCGCRENCILSRLKKSRTSCRSLKGLYNVDQKGVDWKKEQLLPFSVFVFRFPGGAEPVERDGKEAGELLSRYLRIDTTNRRVTKSRRHGFGKSTGAEGLSAQLFESQPGRGVVYARLKGSGEKKALILLHHLDVVPATRADWEVDPFAGVLKDGYVYGRGAIDCKGVAIVQFLTLALLKRAGVPLKRDIIFLGTADEEAGGQLGAGWFVEHHFDLIADAEFLLTEGGGIRVKESGRSYDVDIAEKAPCWLQLESSGPAGHGSRPLPVRPWRALFERLRRSFNMRPKLKSLCCPGILCGTGSTRRTGKSCPATRLGEIFDRPYIS